MHTDHAGQRVAVLHDGERRDGVDTEHRSEVRLLVDVDLAELDLVLFPIELGKDRRHHLARLAPLGPEVNDDEARIVEHLALEVVLRQCDDIGTYKIPKWIREYTGKNPVFEFTSGTELPDDVTSYKMVIHCGGCMLNEREMKYRLKCAGDADIPITNYGTAIAYMKGILERSIEIFPQLRK